MTLLEFEPPLSPPESIPADLRRRGFALGSPRWVSELTQTPLAELAQLAREWDDLPSDPHLRDVGQYRRRLHASFVVEGDHCERKPHRAHFQPPQYNALHGGMLRWFQPIGDRLVQTPAWPRLLCGLGGLFSSLTSTQRWFVEAHQFRIHTQQGVGRPTPEGAHRDGVDFVALLLVARKRIRGGETRVFEAHEPGGQRFTLREPWTALMLDDTRVVHESTPILPSPDDDGEGAGHRDTLVLTYRRGGFQEPTDT